MTTAYYISDYRQSIDFIKVKSIVVSVVVVVEG